MAAKRTAKKASPKKKAAPKKKASPKKADSKKLALRDLRSATLASVKAAIGRLPGGGIINGFVLNEADLDRLEQTPAALAKEVAASTGRAAGLKLKPVVIERPGTIICGFVPPPILA